MSKEIIFKAVLEDGEFKAKLSEIEQASSKADDGIRSFEQGARSLGQQLKTGAGISEFNKAATEVNSTLSQQTKNVKQTTTNISAYGKAVDDTAKKQQSLTSRARQLRNELVALELAGKRDTDQFRQLSNEAARLNDAIGDVSQRTKALASDTGSLDAFAQGVQGIAGGFAAAQGFAALFGSENEDVQKALLKVQATLAIVNGLQAVFNTLNKDSAFLTIANAKATNVVTGAYRLLGIQVNTTTLAFKALRAATIALGIGAVVAVVASLASAFSSLKDEAEEADKAISDLDETIQGFGRAALTADQVIGRIRTGIGQAGISVKELKSALSELESELENFTPENVAVIGPLFGEDEQSPEEIRKRIADAAKAELAELKSNIALIQKEIEKRTSDTAKKVVKTQTKLNEDLFNIFLANFANLLDEEDKLRNESNKERIAAQKAFLSLSLAEQKQQQEQFNETLRLIEQKLQDDLQKLFDERIEKQKKALLELQKLAKEINIAFLDESILALQNDLLQSSLGVGQSYQKQREFLKEQIEKQKQIVKLELERAKAAGATKEQLRQIGLEGDAAIKGLQDSLDNLDFSFAQSLTSELQNLGNSIAQFGKAQSDARIAAINRERELTLQNFEGTLEERERLTKRFAEREKAERRRQAQRERDAAVFNAIINTAVAVTKALATSPALAALIAASGAIQVAAIKAQPLPQFEKGGVVGGKLHRQGGTVIEAERGEFVTNRHASRKHRDLLEAVNTSDTKLNELIFKKFVLPEILGLNKQQSIMVNASLKSDRIESELRKSRKQEISNTKMLAELLQQQQKQSPRYRW
jgi:hypothetical protein